MTKYALITGTTSGIGEALAEQFAQNRINLILVSRDIDKLNRQAESLSSRFGIDVQVIAADLTEEHAAQAIYDQTKQMGITVQYLVNNAGFDEHGYFVETDLANEIGMIKAHAICTTQMMKLYIPDMITAKYGRILNLGSTASFMPCPYNSVYAATKAFILSVSKGVGAELKGTGVTVTALCPGATNTEFARKAGMEDTRLFSTMTMDPATVARIGYKAMLKGKPQVVTGFYNKVQVASSKLLPSALMNSMVKMMLR